MRKVEAIDIAPKDGVGYATFYLDHDKQNIAIMSDYGCFSYDLWSVGRDKSEDAFYKFLKRINVGYVYDKLSSNNEKDIERDLIKEWFYEVTEQRRDGNITKDEARKVWDILSNAYDEFDMNPELLSYALYSNSELTAIFDEPWYSFPVTVKNNACIDFLDKYWDSFIEVINKKLEG